MGSSGTLAFSETKRGLSTYLQRIRNFQLVNPETKCLPDQQRFLLLILLHTSGRGRVRATCLVGQSEVVEAAAEAEGDGEERDGDDHGPRRRSIVCGGPDRIALRSEPQHRSGGKGSRRSGSHFESREIKRSERVRWIAYGIQGSRRSSPGSGRRSGRGGGERLRA
jgi:hypothetical protein